MKTRNYIPALLALIIIPFMFSCRSEEKSEWQLEWADEFEGRGKPDKSRWDYDLGNGCPAICGWGNNELEYYTDSVANARQENGMLIITANYDSLSDKPFTSARLVTRGKAAWLYGRIEAKAKLPSGRGTWPAIWMLPEDWAYGGWPKSGEIDIMEHVGYDQGVVHGTLHSEKYNHLKGTQKEGKITVQDAQENFHVYAVEWEPETVRFYVDDSLYHEVPKIKEDGPDGWPFDRKFHIILNLAVGGNWGGKEGVDYAIWPRSMFVDFVRVYKR